MSLRVAISLLVLMTGAHAHAHGAACPDYAADERAVVRILSYEENASLADAYERLANTWFCSHPNASASDFVAWVQGVQSNQSGSAKIQARAFGADHVVVIWARNDLPDGGRAALYVRQDGRWIPTGSVSLDWTPEIVATLGEQDLVIREQNKISRITTGNIRILHVEATELTQRLIEPDIDNSRIVSKTNRQVVIAFERLPRLFSIDETTLRLAYTLTISRRGKAIVATIQSSTPGLEAMEQFCASATSSRNLGVARQLPDCGSVRVTRVRSPRHDRQDLDIEAPLVCEARDGSLEGIDRAVVSVERVDGAYRVAGLASRGCVLVRARKKGEAL